MATGKILVTLTGEEFDKKYSEVMEMKVKERLRDDEANT